MKNTRKRILPQPTAEMIRQATKNMRGDHKAPERLRTAHYVWRLEQLRKSNQGA